MLDALAFAALKLIGDNPAPVHDEAGAARKMPPI
jgi:hypothetical protein